MQKHSVSRVRPPSRPTNSREPPEGAPRTPWTIQPLSSNKGRFLWELVSNAHPKFSANAGKIAADEGISWLGVARKTCSASFHIIAAQAGVVPVAVIQGNQIDPRITIPLKGIVIHVPISIAILFHNHALLLAESSIYTTTLYHDSPPICITTRLPG